MSATLETYTPENLKPWRLPDCYMGAQWPDYYSFLGQSRDSKPLERANFDAGLKALGGELSDPERNDPEDDGAALRLVAIIRESHWAVGWVEWIAIHKSAIDKLKIADRIKGKLEDYPVIDDELFSEYEEKEAAETWQCYSVKGRIEYIREHRSQFEFQSFADLLGSVRGNYFGGYASELIY